MANHRRFSDTEEPPHAVVGAAVGMTGTTPNGTFDYDWLVIGSGFGGSVSALRLAEKGYRVGVLECGRRYHDDDYAKTTWNARRYFWAPRIGLRGILRLTLFRDVCIVSGCGVGGGSLCYANTLYRASHGFFDDEHWNTLADWQSELEPHYAEAERMLGVTDFPGGAPADDLLRQIGDELGVSHTFKPTRVGVFFGEPGTTVPDPYFGGAGPERAGCIRCGACMVGCRYNAKNTLVKNYLWFAEKLGVGIEAERMVVDVRPIGAADGSDGYVVTSERSGAWIRRQRRTQRARGVVVAAGALGTNSLLQRCRLNGSLPRISRRLGHLVRSNSEVILAASTTDRSRDFTNSLAITSSIYPDADTHIETVTYGRGGDAMSLLSTLLTPDGTRVTRPLKFFGQVLRHPLRFLRVSWPFGWSRRTVILLVMQSLNNSMRLRARKRLFGRGVKLSTEQDPEHPNPTFIPVANWAAARAAELLDGIPQSGITEALFNIPMTAHILGGAAISASAEAGVIDANHRVFGYHNLLVCDGAAIPANVGVNPSLTITALAERAMSHIPPHGSEPRDESSERSLTVER